MVSERNVFFEFGNEQLERVALEVPNYLPGDAANPGLGFDGAGDPIETPVYRVIERGGDSPLVYFHNDTYIESEAALAVESTLINYFPEAVEPNIAKPVRLQNATFGSAQFLNADTYQIVSAGNDNTFGDVDQPTSVDPVVVYPARPLPGSFAEVLRDYNSLDNLSNFGEGRLDGFVTRLINP